MGPYIFRFWTYTLSVWSCIWVAELGFRRSGLVFWVSGIIFWVSGIVFWVFEIILRVCVRTGGGPLWVTATSGAKHLCWEDVSWTNYFVQCIYYRMLALGCVLKLQKDARRKMLHVGGGIAPRSLTRDQFRGKNWNGLKYLYLSWVSSDFLKSVLIIWVGSQINFRKCCL